MSDPTPRDPAGTPSSADRSAVESASVESASVESASVGDSTTAPDPAVAQAAADADAAPVGVVPAPGSHPVLRYTLARLAILAGVAVVLYVLGARGLLLLVFAFLISGLIAMVALNRTREGAAYGITSAIRSANAKIDASTRAEDDALDAAAASVATAAHVDATQPAPMSPPEPAAPVDEWDDPAPR